MTIHPEIIVTPDMPTIRFREPRDEVNLDMELPRILHAQGWGCGTYFHVQFLSHDKTALLASARYVVSEEIESLYTSEADPYQPVTKTVFSRKAERMGEWWPEHTQNTQEALVVWNPGRKVHEVKLGKEVVYSSADKHEAETVAADGISPTGKIWKAA